MKPSGDGLTRVYHVYGINRSGCFVHPEEFTSKKNATAFADKVSNNLETVNINNWQKVH